MDEDYRNKFTKKAPETKNKEEKPHQFILNVQQGGAAAAEPAKEIKELSKVGFFKAPNKQGYKR